MDIDYWDDPYDDGYDPDPEPDCFCSVVHSCWANVMPPARIRRRVARRDRHWRTRQRKVDRHRNDRFWLARNRDRFDTEAPF